MAEGTAITAVPAGLGREAVELLQRLIRADTVNPPGNELALQEQLAGLLSAAGFECELLAAEPERPNLVARLRGDEDGPTLALLGHVDTVRADREEWSRDPWGGEEVDGWIWGRGALDMKGQVASELAACLGLGRSGWRPAGELLLVLVADEETGGDLGARWLCDQHPDKVRSDFVVNEGGGSTIEIGDRRLYTISVGEKGIFRARVTAHGRAGHASLPRVGENALLKLAPIVTRLTEQPPPEHTPEGPAFFTAIFGEPYEGDDAVEAGLRRLRAEQPELADLLAEPMVGVTLTPTVFRSGHKINVIPSSAEVMIDCRVPPGFDADDARERIEAVLGEREYELEFSEAVVGNRSELETPLTDAIRGWLAETDPGAELAPIVMPGFSDSNWFRSAFDSAVVYGFCPHRAIPLLELAPLIHGADERVPAADVELAAGFFFELPQRVLS
ncbi:MAG TPA: M20/M25/M40 family metallo-hydrolase [Solirubrobacterales bacterium]|jgi:acetylornithine deacetylase/succinyl-diaminopimelate desuccinylase-like protein|nr:M20/M25/M40 family metallo-hydrolase [Solirubrobacterales bacterium]